MTPLPLQCKNSTFLVIIWFIFSHFSFIFQDVYCYCATDLKVKYAGGQN